MTPEEYLIDYYSNIAFEGFGDLQRSREEKSTDYCLKAAVIIEKMAQIFYQASIFGDVKILTIDSQMKFINNFKKRHSTI